MGMPRLDGGGYEGPEAAPHRTDVRNFQDPAHMTFRIEQEEESMPSSASEKTKMLRGKFFRWMDPTLATDRLRCKRALVCFNNAGMADDAADPISRKMLGRVLVPDSSNSLHTDKPIGSLGPGAVVETPFRCEYGYNIKISEDVYIGPECTIIDACTVIIGQKTTIEPKVTIIAGGPGTGCRGSGRNKEQVEGSPSQY
jgi:white-opaque regulator 2